MKALQTSNLDEWFLSEADETGTDVMAQKESK